MTSKPVGDMVCDPDEKIAAGGRIALFIGAGISSGCATKGGKKPPTWSKLVSNLADKYRVEQMALQGLDIIDQADIVFSNAMAMRETSFTFAKEVAKNVDWIDGEFVEPSDIFDVFAEIEPLLIITTNYDTVIERFFSRDDQAFNIWSYPGRIDELMLGGIFKRNGSLGDPSLGDLLRSGEPLIAKVHGTVPPMDAFEEPTEESMSRVAEDGHPLVFSWGSYDEAYSLQSEIPGFLSAVFATHQVVFVGYSLTDDVLRRILSGAGSLKGTKYRHIFFQKHDASIPNAYRKIFEDRYGITVESYKEHSDLSDVLKKFMGKS